MTALAYRLVFCLGLVLFAAACESAVMRPQFAEFTYGHLAPIDIDVARVEFVDDYAPPLAEPHVEHFFPVAPATAVERWVADRLRPVGVQRTLRVHLEEASAVATPLPSRGGIDAWFTTEQVETVAGRIVARADIVADNGRVEGFATAEVSRSRTVPEDLTLNERDQLYFELVEAMMDDFNATFETNIRTYLWAYVR